MNHNVLSYCFVNQPVANGFVERISAALKMVYDMKRIGAQSAEIVDIIGDGHVHEGADFRHLKANGQTRCPYGNR